MTGERADVDLTKVTNWKDRLEGLYCGYGKADVFNMDETGLFFRDTMRKSFHVKGKSMQLFLFILFEPTVES